MIGETLGHYKILDLLGAGGMGEVYRAEDMTLDREVALKVLPAELSADPDRLARFEREAKVLAALNHPNIAAIYSLESAEVGTEAGRDGVEVDSREAVEEGLAPSRRISFLVMELAEGEDLAERIARGPIPMDQGLAMALQIAEALEAAHAIGVVHRDLKPANIKVGRAGVD